LDIKGLDLGYKKIERRHAMTKKIGRFIFYGLPGLLVIVMFSCYPSGPSDVTDTDVVITAYDSQFNFGNIRTYALPNEVFELEGSDDVNHDYDDIILDEIEKNMNALGYVRENNPLANGADIVVIAAIGRTDQTWVGGGGWWGWPGWGYWPPYGPGWGIWYPWPTVVTFSTGTLFIQMLDPNDPNQDEEQIPARWAGALNGVLSSSTAADVQRIISNIAQMFDQSPYLGR
jgi:hypothetical protein